MQLFKRKARSSSRVGLAVHSDQLALAHVEQRAGEPWLRQCERVAIDSPKAAAKTLAKLVKELDLAGKQVSYVLNPADYGLHLVEAPNVEPEELRAAVRWKIKDLLDMKAEEAAIDVFRVPQDAYRGREMVYVVTTQKSRIQTIVDLVNNAELELAVIDIPELVMQNIAVRYLNDDNGLAFMDLRHTGSTMNITRGGELYLTRRINTQLGQEVMRSPDWDTLKDRMVLEIQRSLDYYESQSGKSQITEVVIAQRQTDTEELTRELDSLLPAKVSALDLSRHLDGDVTQTPELQQVALTAIGATLRGGRKQEKESGPADAEAEESDESGRSAEEAA
ncbi:MAG: hypothetical protein WD396_10090 [Pseudohongiellaceae bacterium]